MTELPSRCAFMVGVEQRWLDEFNRDSCSVSFFSARWKSILILLADDMFHPDLSDIGDGKFDLESSGGVVDVISEASFHGREIADEIHGITRNPMPWSNRKGLDR